MRPSLSLIAVPEWTRAVLAAIALTAPASHGLAQADHCSGATVISANTVYHGSNVGATSDIAQSSCSYFDSLDVWYRFTAGAAGDYTIDTNGSALDTTLAIYSVCGGAELACNDDADPWFGTDSLITITLTAGQTIYVRVAGYLADEGSFDIFITPPAAQPTTGACRGATCAVAAPADCTGANSSFVGLGIACNAPGNNTTPCCKADFNRSGSATVPDIFAFLAAWFAHDPGADIDGVNGVQVPDIFAFLVAWFAGC